MKLGRHKATPGIYKAKEYKGGYGVYTQHGDLLAVCQGSDKTLKPLGNEQNENNAKLFAAARDLLNASELALGAIDQEKYSVVCKIIRKAVVKAHTGDETTEVDFRSKVRS